MSEKIVSVCVSLTFPTLVDETNLRSFGTSLCRTKAYDYNISVEYRELRIKKNELFDNNLPLIDYVLTVIVMIFTPAEINASK
jgi:hypothetical protein